FETSAVDIGSGDSMESERTLEIGLLSGGPFRSSERSESRVEEGRRRGSTSPATSSRQQIPHSTRARFPKTQSIPDEAPAAPPVRQSPPRRQRPEDRSARSRD